MQIQNKKQLERGLIYNRPLSKLVKVVQNYKCQRSKPEIKLNLRPNLLRLFRYLSAII
ncbi:Uncharacterised protein [Orientia tsutsugamushi]|uniref:Uncharacterized protein n=1 Tax=Orientia tsutsugamushi TaxID=784 RepID=A0A2U3QPG4_ORITS|nr:Uncharacterised protein [Orientia tsutsugamushi]